MDRKAPNILEDLEKMNKDLERSRPLHEIEGMALDNQKKAIEIEILRNKLKDYNITRIITWTGFAISVLLGWLKLAEAIRIWPYHK
jgi:hypothetical protein